MMIDQGLRTERNYDGVAAACAALSGIASLLYGVAFIVLGNIRLSAAILMVSGLLTAVALVGVYARLRVVDSAAATLGLALGLVGAIGALVHGGLDLATSLHPIPGALADAPNPVDPRGLLTFGVAGLGLVVLGLLVTWGDAFPRLLGYLAMVTGALLVLLYLARLIVLDPTNPLVLGPALITGFVLNPLLYVWLGYRLSRP
jgi:hypothetical protein